MKKHILLTPLALTAFVGLAWAQPGAAPKPSAVVATPALVAASSASTGTPGINPLTGNLVSFEEKQRLIEATKQETTLLEEQLKLAVVKKDLNLFPLKEKQERQKFSDGPAVANAGFVPPSGGSKSRPTNKRGSKGKPSNEPAQPVVMSPPPAMPDPGSGYMAFGDVQIPLQRSGKRIATIATSDPRVDPAQTAAVGGTRPATGIGAPPVPPQLNPNPNAVPITPRSPFGGR